MTALLVVTALGSCSALDAIAPFVGGNDGVSVSADTQIGRENTRQIVGSQTIVEGTNSGNNSKVSGDVAGDVILKEGPSIWLLAFLVLGWILPSPSQIANSLLNLFRKKK